MESTQKGFNQTKVFLEEGESHSFNRHNVKIYCVPGIMRDARYIDRNKESPVLIELTVYDLTAQSMVHVTSVKHHLSLSLSFLK